MSQLKYSFLFNVIFFLLTLLNLNPSIAQSKKLKSSDVGLVFTSDYQLPNGRMALPWYKPMANARDLYVDIHAADGGDGSLLRPFKYIAQAVKVANAGSRINIKKGVYRERIRPHVGGESIDKMLEFVGDEGTIVKGSKLFDVSKLKPNTKWKVGKLADSMLIYSYKFEEEDFIGYNPFATTNVMHEREWLNHKLANMEPHFLRRGQVFINGKRIKQIARFFDIGQQTEASFWPEHNGLEMLILLPKNIDLKTATLEYTFAESVFDPTEMGLGYIRISGIKFMHAGNGFPVPQKGLISARRGHHWVIENCTIESANSVGIDLGNEMWGSVSQPIVGGHIFRNNIVDNCGICGLAIYKAWDCIVVNNTFSNIGWQNAEHAFESGAIKFHESKNTLIAGNLIKHIKHAPGLWLDYGDYNCRVTKNVFYDIITARGAVYVEVGRNKTSVDANIMAKTRSQYWLSGDYGAGGSALYTDGTDSLIFANNLCFDIENTGFGSYFLEARMVYNRGGFPHAHLVTNNIFADCKKYFVELPNTKHQVNGNYYSPRIMGQLTIKNPAPQVLLDLPTWQTHFGYDKSGGIFIGKFEMDINTMKLKTDIQSGTLKSNVGPFEIKSGEYDLSKFIGAIK